MAAQQNFTVFKGDTFKKTPVFRRKTSKTPIDLTGAIVVGTVKQGAVELPMICSVVNATGGQFQFEIQTNTLNTGMCSYEVHVTYLDGTVQTLLFGNLIVQARI